MLANFLNSFTNRLSIKLLATIL